MLDQKAAGFSKRLAVFTLQGSDELLYHEEPIWRDGIRVGHISSGAYGHTVGAAIGLGYIKFEGSFDRETLLASQYEIEVAGHKIPATMSLSPLYDPKNTAIRR